MRLLADMTTEEICALTEEQLDRRVKLECAEQGVQMVPEPPEIEAFDIPKTVVAYKVTGCDFHLQSLDAAKELAALIQKHQAVRFKEKYDWRLGYEVKWVERDESDIAVDTVMFYDANVVRSREDFLVKRKTIMEEYSKEKKKYEDSREKYRKIADSVYCEFYDARNKKRAIASAQKTYQEYLSLADGDQAKARTFFDKAFKDSMDKEVYDSVVFIPSLPMSEEEKPRELAL